MAGVKTENAVKVDAPEPVRPKTDMEKLKECETVRVRLPLTRDEEGKLVRNVVSVAVNGVHMQILEGVEVDLPVPMYLVLRQSGQYDL